MRRPFAFLKSIFKNGSIALVLLFSYHAAALPSAPRTIDPSKDFSRLSYYPHKNSFNLSSRLNFAVSGLSESSLGDKPVSSTTTNFTSFDGALNYGLNDWLRFGMSQSFLLTSLSHTALVGAYATLESSSYGFAEPSFNMSFRILNPRRPGLSGDFFIAGSPSFPNHYVTSQSQIGDNNRGFSTATSGFSFYESTQKNDVLISFSATREFQGAASSDSALTSYTRAEIWNFTGALADRYVWSSVYLQAEIDTALARDTQLTFGQSSGGPPAVVKTISTPMVISPKLILGLKLNERANLETEFVQSNLTTTSLQSNSNLGSSNKVQLSTLSVRLRIAF